MNEKNSLAGFRHGLSRYGDALHDRWYSAEEALAYGFVDEIATRFADVMPPLTRRTIGLTAEGA